MESQRYVHKNFNNASHINKVTLGPRESNVSAERYLKTLGSPVRCFASSRSCLVDTVRMYVAYFILQVTFANRCRTSVRAFVFSAKSAPNESTSLDALSLYWKVSTHAIAETVKSRVGKRQS